MRKLTLPRRISLILVIAACLFSPSFLLAQGANMVHGQVTDSTGSPISGVSVSVVGSRSGTSTDKAGNFTIKIQKGQTLELSSVGYRTERVVYSGQAITVSLHQAGTNLNDVVVIGYGTQRKEAVTGSVASINGDNLRAVPTVDVSNALQGRLPGVVVQQTSSQPGAAMQIRIRGTRSLTAGNDPLVVLDGIPFPGSLTDIDMNDVKSIDILKDASATAIYGSRGSNGVILITTNRGGNNQEPRVTVNGYYGWQKAIYFPMMNGPQLAALRKAANGVVVPNQQNGSIGLGTDENLSTNTNWQKLLFQTGNVTNEDVSVSSGTKRGSYNFGASYYRDQAVIPTSNYQRLGFHGSADQHIGKYIHAGFTTNDNYNVTQGSQVGMYTALSNSPLASPFNPNGTTKYFIAMPLDQQWVQTKFVLDSLKNTYISQQKGFASYNSTYVEIKIPGVEGLAYRVNAGFNYYTSNSGSYTGQGVNSTNPAAPSTAATSYSTTTDWTVENLLTYDRTFGKSQLNVLGLYSSQQTQSHGTSISGIGIPSDAFQYYNIGSASTEIDVLPANQSYTERGLESGMGRIMYSYDNRYMISGTVRSDGASVLAPGHQWHTYPAVSAGWNLGNESFMRGVTAIDALKLRVGYGQTSNQSVTPYSTMGLLSTNPYNFGPSTYATGYYVSQLPDPLLTWEYSKTQNYAVDFALLKNRLTGTVEYYITKTDGLLQSVGLPPTSGVGSYTANVGNTQNKGFELALDGIILQTRGGLTWEAGVNVSVNRNKITHLANNVQQDVGDSWFVGHPINNVYDYKKIGLWTSAQDSTSGYEGTLQPGSKVGDIKVQYTGGYKSDGTPNRAVDADDRQIINLDPSFTGGFNTTVRYKGFDLTAIGIFQGGGVLISSLYGPASYLNLMSGRRNNVNVDYWTPTNTGAKYPNPAGFKSGDNPAYASTLAYFKGGYMKLSTATLGYTLSRQPWFRKLGIPQLRVYFTAQNPLVMFSPYHKETKLDPETNALGNQDQAVISYNSRTLIQAYNTPSTRNYIFGINLTF